MALLLNLKSISMKQFTNQFLLLMLEQSLLLMLERTLLRFHGLISLLQLHLVMLLLLDGLTGTRLDLMPILLSLYLLELCLLISQDLLQVQLILSLLSH
jgi:hypothetical protein